MKTVTTILIILGITLPTLLFGQTAGSVQGVAPCFQPTQLAVPCSFIQGCGQTGEKSKRGGIALNPFLQVGYQRNGLNMDVPLRAEFDPPLPGPHLAVGSINVVLEDYNFWMGTAGVNAVVSPEVTVFASATGFLPRDFVQVGKLPVSIGNFDFVPLLAFTGSKLEYWMLQCGASYGIGDGYALLGGFIWGKNSMIYTNPRIGDVPLQNQTVRQDFLIKNWVPFVGLQVSEPNHYRAALIYSPLVTSSGTLVNRTSLPVPTALTYNLNQPGSMLSFTFEYSLQVPPPSMLSLWFNGTTQSIKGPSDVTYEAPGVFITRTADKLAIYQYSLAGGVTMGIMF
jgi:hypothetical protein